MRFKALIFSINYLILMTSSASAIVVTARLRDINREFCVGVLNALTKSQTTSPVIELAELRSKFPELFSSPINVEAKWQPASGGIKIEAVAGRIRGLRSDIENADPRTATVYLELDEDKTEITQRISAWAKERSRSINSEGGLGISNIGLQVLSGANLIFGPNRIASGLAFVSGLMGSYYKEKPLRAFRIAQGLSLASVGMLFAYQAYSQGNNELAKAAFTLIGAGLTTAATRKASFVLPPAYLVTAYFLNEANYSGWTAGTFGFAGAGGLFYDLPIEAMQAYENLTLKGSKTFKYLPDDFTSGLQAIGVIQNKAADEIVSEVSGASEVKMAEPYVWSANLPVEPTTLRKLLRSPLVLNDPNAKELLENAQRNGTPVYALFDTIFVPSSEGGSVIHTIRFTTTEPN
ncbi:MAG: hypothetical protein JWQ35_280 [Bacteriovoracaceae bacterium]|nr:hypothetical protein [Bacteriovoracaceae bacterium]